MMRNLAAVTAASILALGLVACGGTSTAPVVSPSDSGNAALESSEGVEFFGTKGVEVTVTNTASDTFYVWRRGGGAVEALASGSSRTFRGERNFADDVELDTSWNANGVPAVEFDFSNPTVGSPNLAVGRGEGGLEMYFFSVGQTHDGSETAAGRRTSWSVLRESDTSDYKRFTMTIRPSLFTPEGE